MTRYARTLAPGQLCRVIVFDVATNTATVVHETDAILLEAPNWTASGDLILNGDGTLWRLPASGGSAPVPIVIDGIPELNNDHVLAPGGETIFLSANDGHVYEAPLAGGQARKVTPNDGRMHFLHGVSPDGTTLAYVGLTPADGDWWAAAHVHTIGVDGTGDRQLTAGPGPDDGPEYSPDGKWIHLNTERFARVPGHAQIARMRPDGSEFERLTVSDRVDWFPHLAPTGGLAVYLSFPAGTTGHPADLPVELHLVEDGAWRSPRIVARLHGGQGTINVNSWSPDGTRFAYVEYPGPEVP
ncbi:biopolymer transporter Tol [Microbacterium sp. SS28]|uniref:TolB family protein n=1 Tax=Microbacterium sp. SS28 TaxID=2919948 RepID=UPI001FAA275B|nr:biopolymer transporter Tol [Microbacterium sp. SS28]